jgi:hypothetical protein
MLRKKLTGIDRINRMKKRNYSVIHWFIGSLNQPVFILFILSILSGVTIEFEAFHFVLPKLQPRGMTG